MNNEAHSVFIVSLGCSKNLVDTEKVMARLKNSGLLLTTDLDEADAVAINTCGFIRSAEEESLDTIAELCELKAEGNIQGLVVWGCLVNRYGESLPTQETPFDNVDAWLPIQDIDRVAEVLKGLMVEPPIDSGCSALESPVIGDRMLATPRHTAYLRLAEGCDNRCSYCTIPKIRGPFRSRPCAEIIDEAKALAQAGVLEINLIAQDITRYGTDLYGKSSLPDLLQELDAVPGLEWIRLLYAHPSRVDDALIDAIGSSQRVCHYLDMPIQHASDRVLRAMNRGMSQKELETVVTKTFERVPDMILRTTVMVGFPGETKKDFSVLRRFLNEMPFEYVGIFPYSREIGTPAHSMEQVPQSVIQKRLEILTDEIDYLCEERRSRFLGQTVEVLVDGRCPDAGWYHGRWKGQAPDVDGHVYFRSAQDNPVGTMVPVTLTHLVGADFTGGQG